MHFQGFLEPTYDEPLIELEFPNGEWVDLYNDCYFSGINFHEGRLSFMFKTLKGVPLSVDFTEVSNLTVEQPGDWDVQESTQIDHFQIRPLGPWRRVVFKAGGVHYEFDASCMRVEAPVASRSGATFVPPE